MSQAVSRFINQFWLDLLRVIFRLSAFLWACIVFQWPTVQWQCCSCRGKNLPSSVRRSWRLMIIKLSDNKLILINATKWASLSDNESFSVVEPITCRSIGNSFHFFQCMQSFPTHRWQNANFFDCTTRDCDVNFYFWEEINPSDNFFFCSFRADALFAFKAVAKAVVAHRFSYPPSWNISTARSLHALCIMSRAWVAKKHSRASLKAFLSTSLLYRLQWTAFTPFTDRSASCESDSRAVIWKKKNPSGLCRAHTSICLQTTGIDWQTV